MKIAITGSPQAGKTHMAKRLGAETGIPVYHTDSILDDLEAENFSGARWSEVSRRAAKWFAEPAYIIEGVAVPRALRKYLAAGGSVSGLTVTYLECPGNALSRGQDAMGKGIRTVLAEITPVLRAQGATIEVVVNVF